ncbi:MAG TPA: universal stress protein [Methylomirabilota bacterium]|nr:universal stress protein [Methylomirabilota bacterium]
MTPPPARRRARAGAIVHPTDFSPASRPAFRAALALARHGRATLLLVHVVAPMIQVPDVAVVSPPTYARFLDAAETAARRRLQRLVRAARRAGVRAAGLVVHGVPHEEIVRVSRRRRARVVVIGTHGLTGFRRALLGSVAARVVALAPCPVLTVRAALGRTAAA